MSNKQSSVIHIRNWVRTNGDMSEDGQSITYSCKELEAIIEQAKAMHKEELEFAFKGGMSLVEGHLLKPIDKFEEFYNQKFNNEQHI